MKNVSLFVFCFLLLSLSGPPAFPQATSRVTGLVQDKTGAIVVGAKVTLTNEATNVSVSTVTTSSGAYVFDGIVPGSYAITVVAPGFSTYSSKSNVLTIAQPWL